MTDTQLASTTTQPATTGLLTGPLAFLRRGWASLDAVQRGLWGLMLLRLVIALIFMLDILPLDLRFRWFLHHGGDQDDMMALAVSILDGNPQPSVVGIGQALVMIPWIVLFNTQNYFKIVAPLVLINGFLFGGLSVPVLGGIARRTTGDDRVALWSAALWAVLPLLTYFAFFWHFDPVLLRSANVPKIGWLNGLSDGPATFFLMLAVLLLAGAEREGEKFPLWRMAGAGAAMGVAVMYRVHVAPMVAFLLAYVLVARGWRSLLVVCLGGLIAYTPQAWYNQVVFGFPITTGYISYFTVRSGEGALSLGFLRNLPYHPRHVMELINYFIGRRPWLLAPLVLAGLAGLYTLITLWRRRGWRAVALLIGSPLAYIGPMATAWPFRDDVIRFSLPALPFFIVAGVYAVRTAQGTLTARRRKRETANDSDTPTGKEND